VANRARVDSLFRVFFLNVGRAHYRRHSPGGTEPRMFSVLFEVKPKSDQWDAYLGHAKGLRPRLERIDGFIDNIRYASLTRQGWILSLSNWRDEKSLVRWRTQAEHHAVQEKGRFQILGDYHLRVGQITQDTHVPVGYALTEQRLDETQTGTGTTVTLIDGKRVPSMSDKAPPEDIARHLGLDNRAPGLLSWDVFDAVLTPGELILMILWRDHNAAEKFGESITAPTDSRQRRVRVVRDYSMHDRREAPQYYRDVERP
jgi:heme-degrading monooxygenase HmoA